jgi:hypothetical protein
VLARWGLGWQHKVVVSVDVHNCPILPPATPLTGGDGRDVHNWTLGPELEVIGANQVSPLPSPS